MRKREVRSKAKKIRKRSKAASARTVASPDDGDAYIRDQLKDPLNRYYFEQRMMILEIARTVKGLRLNAGVTQTQLAKMINSTQSVIARLENPENVRLASFDTLQKIAYALGRQLTMRFGLDLSEPEEKRGPMVIVEDDPRTGA